MEAPEKRTYKATPVVKLVLKFPHEYDSIAFTHWMLLNQILCESGGGGNPHLLVGYWLPEDAEKIIQWCKDKGFEIDG